MSYPNIKEPNWQFVDRFLILGTEGTTFSAADQKLTRDRVPTLLSLIKSDGARVVRRIVEIDRSGRAVKVEPGIFALALCAAYGETETRQAAFEAVPGVCHEATHLFQFIAECEQLRGWGRGLRKAVARWYVNMPADELTYQAILHQHHGGWSHRDLLRLSHPKPPTEEHRTLFKWIVDDELTGKNARLEAFLKLMRMEDPHEAAELIRTNPMPRECVPSHLLNESAVWEALLEHMDLISVIRNLANITRAGLLRSNSESAKRAISSLRNPKEIEKARLHPISILMALATYGSGHGLRGQHAWTPVPEALEALEDGFALSLDFVEPINQRIFLALDVSGSMSGWTVGGTPLSACEAATAMALTLISTEPEVTAATFSDGLKPLPIRRGMKLPEALVHTRDLSFGGTDIALPLLFALEHEISADLFIVFTDNEGGPGRINPVQALRHYREKTGIPAKLAVVGMCSKGFAIADPKDPGMLDIFGFDATVPAAIREFAMLC